jgi:signal transduction histidine kinase/AmiR/NasT family two-component response regulator
LLSLLAAIAASGVALFVVSRETMTLPMAAVGALFMGGGIAAMHYIGMEAMRMPAMCQYLPDLVMLSVLLAIVIAFTALQMSYAFRSGAGWSWYKVGTALILGAAIPITHYVGMAAVTFVEMPFEQAQLRHAIAISDLEAVAIAAVTLMVASLVFLSSTVDRKLAAHTQVLESTEERFRLIVEGEREAAKMAADAGNRAKSEFLANVSDEIRTPMNAVIGMAELLLDTPLDAMQRNYAEDIRDNANALLNVINDILDFSKAEAGNLELEQLDVDLRDTFEDVSRLLAIHAHAKGLELTAQIDPRLPPRVVADAGRVRQIVLNLVSNAVKFTQHGEVSLDVKVLEINERGTHIRCEVLDTRAGVLEVTRQMDEPGVRISMVRRLVELMGGVTGVQTTPGAGSRTWFTAWFGASALPAETFVTAPATLRGQRVLLVDDNATNRKVLLGQLLQCGVDPVSAATAGEALMLIRHAAAAGRPIDAALIDQQLPDCDGADLGRMIMEDDTLDSTRLILLTSTGQRGEGQQFSDLGFAGYLLKPVSQRDLTDCLMLALGSATETWRTRNLPMITRHGLRAQRPQ